MQWLLVVLVCGAFDCHHDRVGYYATHEECVKAAGYTRAPRRHPTFKCVELALPETE
jgi:hypothetical protein